MKSTQFFVPLFFSVLAAAAPLRPRGLTTTEVVYTTVFLDPGQPIPTQQPVTTSSSSTLIPQFNEAPAKTTSSSTSVATQPPAQASPSYNSNPPASSPASTGSGSTGSVAAVGEKHTGVRFSAISNYNDPLQPVQKIETWGGCATYGQPLEYKMSDADGDMRVALDDTVPNFYSYCGKKIRLMNPDGRTAVATIVDRCPKCGADGGPYSLDLLEAPWEAVGGGASSNNVYQASWEIIE